MDYEKIYSNLIDYRKNNVPLGYTENHHIIPSSLGGTADKSNMVALTGREHYIAHLLLARFNKCNETIYAAYMMGHIRVNKCAEKIKVNSRLYQWLREEASVLLSNLHKGRVISEEHRKQISEFHKGKKKTDEHKQNMSISAKVRWADNQIARDNISKKLTGRIISLETCQKLKDRIITDEWRSNIGLASLGRIKTQETRNKIADSNRGGTRSDEQKNTMSKSASERWEKYINDGECVKWWNNGKENKRSINCPGEGWIDGMLKRRIQR